MWKYVGNIYKMIFEIKLGSKVDYANVKFV